MAEAATAAPLGRARPYDLAQWIAERFVDRSKRRAIVALAAALALWEIGADSGAWLGAPLPVLGAVPAPHAVLAAFAKLLHDSGYWQSWAASLLRVAFGFVAALAVGVPFGLVLASYSAFRGAAFPVFELLRPIPPLAWVPASIIFWPTQELSIAFVIFLGGFYTMVLNVVGGADVLDRRLIQSARSMGASRVTIFQRLILPGVLPSIGVGMEIAIGVTWEVVVAAEMISGGGSGASASSGGGLGFFIWNSYVGGAYPDIVVGMISIGIAGYVSSALVRRAVIRLAPWLKRK
jgi:NitT/TauT family transport system permease protein